MKYLAFSALVLAGFIGTGCGHGRTSEVNTKTNPEPVTTTNTTVQTQIPPVNPDPNKTPSTITTTQPLTVTNSAAVLNPAHGQPGHRCDIGVGAPLDSKPVQPATNNVSVSQPVNSNNSKQTVSSITPVNPISSQTVAKGLNPAHGQPGHRCEIAVGAPLDSKPAQTTTTTASQPVITNTSNTTLSPIITSTDAASSLPLTTSSQTVAKGLNPAHGQPGHRCDIAVGAPLDSKPAQTTVPDKSYKPTFNLVKSATDSTKQ